MDEIPLHSRIYQFLNRKNTNENRLENSYYMCPICLTNCRTNNVILYKICHCNDGNVCAECYQKLNQMGIRVCHICRQTLKFKENTKVKVNNIPGLIAIILIALGLLFSKICFDIVIPLKFFQKEDNLKFSDYLLLIILSVIIHPVVFYLTRLISEQHCCNKNVSSFLYCACLIIHLIASLLVVMSLYRKNTQNTFKHFEEIYIYPNYIFNALAVIVIACIRKKGFCREWCYPHFQKRTTRKIIKRKIPTPDLRELEDSDNDLELGELEEIDLDNYQNNYPNSSQLNVSSV